MKMRNNKPDTGFSKNRNYFAISYFQVATFVCIIIFSSLMNSAHSELMSYEVVFDVKSAEYLPFPPGFEFDSFTTPRYFSSFPGVGDSFIGVNFSLDTTIPPNTDLLRLEDDSVIVKLEPDVFIAEVGGIVWDASSSVNEAGFFGGPLPLPGDLPGFKIDDDLVTEIRGVLRKLGSGIWIDFGSNNFSVNAPNGRIQGDYTVRSATVASPDTLVLLVLGIGLLLFIIQGRGDSQLT